MKIVYFIEWRKVWQGELSSIYYWTDFSILAMSSCCFSLSTYKISLSLLTPVQWWFFILITHKLSKPIDCHFKCWFDCLFKDRISNFHFQWKPLLPNRKMTDTVLRNWKWRILKTLTWTTCFILVYFTFIVYFIENLSHSCFELTLSSLKQAHKLGFFCQQSNVLYSNARHETLVQNFDPIIFSKKYRSPLVISC